VKSAQQNHISVIFLASIQDLAPVRIQRVIRYLAAELVQTADERKSFTLKCWRISVSNQQYAPGLSAFGQGEKRRLFLLSADECANVLDRPFSQATGYMQFGGFEEISDLTRLRDCGVPRSFIFFSITIDTLATSRNPGGNLRCIRCSVCWTTKAKENQSRQKKHQI